MKIVVEPFEESLSFPLFKQENWKLEVFEAFISVDAIEVGWFE